MKAGNANEARATFGLHVTASASTCSCLQAAPGQMLERTHHFEYRTGARKTELRHIHMVLAYLDIDIGDPEQHSRWDSEYALSSSFYARSGPQVRCMA